MAHLTRWQKRVPKWLGNDQAAEPFAVEIKRVTEGELRGFFAALTDLDQDRSPGKLVEIFSPVVRGPKGQLTVDGEEVTDLRGLLAAGADEFSPTDSLLGELVRLVQEVNGLGKATPSASGPQPGGAGSIPAELATPTPAGGAGSPSSAAST